jgi:hypothetical protein
LGLGAVAAGGFGTELGWHFRLEYTWGVEG